MSGDEKKKKEAKPPAPPAVPVGFDPEDFQKPKTRNRLSILDRERIALETWIETQDMGKVREAVKASSNESARVIVNRAIENWMTDHTRHVQDMFVRQNLILGEAIGESWKRYKVNPDQGTADLVRLLERQSKLNDLDVAKKPEPDTGPKVVFEVRLPWARDEAPKHGDVIDAEFEVVEKKELPPGD